MKQIFGTLMILFTALTMAQESSSLRQKQFNLDDNLAIKGYDPVSYFIQEEPEEGKNNINTEYNGIIYHFSSEKNKTTFLENPSKYEPQYGGWCAYAMGDDGTKVSINPKSYKIVDDKLYLFYHTLFSNTLKCWNKDETNLKKNANINWNKTTTN
ncbi:MAG: YHS domain-containing (seleno)protein [Aquaticitalea sp.]